MAQLDEPIGVQHIQYLPLSVQVLWTAPCEPQFSRVEGATARERVSQDQYSVQHQQPIPLHRIVVTICQLNCHRSISCSIDSVPSTGMVQYRGKPIRSKIG
jgi:hypothetical protein